MKNFSTLLLGAAILSLLSACVQSTTTTSTSDEPAVVRGAEVASRVVIHQVASTPVKVITAVGHAAQVVEKKVDPDSSQ